MSELVFIAIVLVAGGFALSIPAYYLVKRIREWLLPSAPWWAGPAPSCGVMVLVGVAADSLTAIANGKPPGSGGMFELLALLGHGIAIAFLAKNGKWAAA